METLRLDLLDMFGCGYVIEHCIAAINKKRQDEALRYYATDCLWLIANAWYQGKPIKQRFYDLLHPQPVDNRTPQEIADDIARRAGLKVVKRD